MEQVSFTESGLAPNEQRIVGPCGLFGDGQSRRVGKSVRGTDDEGVEGVSAVETGLVCGVGSVGSGALGEIPRPTLVRTRQGFAVVVDFVQIGVVGVRNTGVRPSRVPIGAGFDTHTQFDSVAQVAAEGLHDGFPQVALDFILDEWAGYGKQCKALRNRQRPNQLEPCPLLRRQRWVTVQLRDHRTPHRGKIRTGIIVQRRIPLLHGRAAIREPNRNLSTYLSTGVHRAGGSVRRSVTALLVRRQTIRLLANSDFPRWQKTNRFPDGCQPVNASQADRELWTPITVV